MPVFGFNRRVKTRGHSRPNYLVTSESWRHRIKTVPFLSDDRVFNRRVKRVMVTGDDQIFPHSPEGAIASGEIITDGL